MLALMYPTSMTRVKDPELDGLYLYFKWMLIVGDH